MYSGARTGQFSKTSVYAAACGGYHALMLACNRTVPKLEALPLCDIFAVSGTHNSFTVDRAGAVCAWGLNQMRQTGVDDTERLIKTPTEADRRG
ncbi:hypothetical protein B0H17DRAFT_1193287 [Mycena rosella]|uniref:Uncharacterized protein n=1 Tax=Mycena rosella TaxID=1033263 RepID=A0AAD7GT72_MYCRO|nr:hypothetical protein B0H17DRAFT_1193287 [Mycena rosella]